jgi:hypothetical protein
LIFKAKLAKVHALKIFGNNKLKCELYLFKMSEKDGKKIRLRSGYYAR